MSHPELKTPERTVTPTVPSKPAPARPLSPAEETRDAILRDAATRPAAYVADFIAPEGE